MKDKNHEIATKISSVVEKLLKEEELIGLGDEVEILVKITPKSLVKTKVQTKQNKGELRTEITKDEWDIVLNLKLPEDLKSVLERLYSNGNKPTTSTDLFVKYAKIERINSEFRKNGLLFRLKGSRRCDYKETSYRLVVVPYHNFR